MEFPTVLRLNKETPLNQYEKTGQFDNGNYTCTFGKKANGFCLQFILFPPPSRVRSLVLESNTFTQVVTHI